ncbi:hypothetical protein ACMHYB_47635 [Sorangium sp. So ce1128]
MSNPFLDPLRENAVRLYNEYLSLLCRKATDERVNQAKQAWLRAERAVTDALTSPLPDSRGPHPREAEQAELNELLRKAKGL